MDPNHHSALLIHNENEIKPTHVRFEHWITNKDENHSKLYKGCIFNQIMECKDFKSNILMAFNNHTRKKGVETQQSAITTMPWTNMAC